MRTNNYAHKTHTHKIICIPCRFTEINSQSSVALPHDHRWEEEEDGGRASVRERQTERETERGRERDRESETERERGVIGGDIA